MKHLDFCALISLDFCAAVSLLLLENRDLLQQLDLLSLSSSLLLKNEQVKPFCLPHAFLFTLSEFLNPMVEKESNQWTRLIESENHFYLFLINKITHPLKFIKK